MPVARKAQVIELGQHLILSAKKDKEAFDCLNVLLPTIVSTGLGSSQRDVQNASIRFIQVSALVFILFSFKLGENVPDKNVEKLHHSAEKLSVGKRL